MLSRKITITLSCCNFGWFLLALGVILMVRESFGAWNGYHSGWAGLSITLLGKHLLNRVMIVHLEQEVEDATVRELEAFRLGQRSPLIPTPRTPLEPVR